MKTVHCVLTSAIVLFVTAMAHADKKEAAVKAESRGMIEKVDSLSKTITLKTGKPGKGDGEKTLTLTVSDQTEYFSEPAGQKNKIGLLDLTAGKMALVVHETKDGKTIVTSVTLVEQKKKDK